MLRFIYINYLNKLKQKNFIQISFIKHLNIIYFLRKEL